MCPDRRPISSARETGDAWLLDLSDHLARDGGPESIAFEETDTGFQIAWPGNYRLDGPAFTIPIVKAAASPP
jgi:hypothetical protein